MCKECCEIWDRVDLQSLHHRPFGSVLRGDIKTPESRFLGRNRHGKCAADGAHFPGKGEFPQKHAVFQPGVQLAGGAQQGDQDWKVIECTFFALVRRGEIHGDPADGKLKPHVFQRRPDTVPRFTYRGVRQSHHLEGGEAPREIRFYLDHKGVQPIQPHTVYFFHHRSFPRSCMKVSSNYTAWSEGMRKRWQMVT